MLNTNIIHKQTSHHYAHTPSAAKESIVNIPTDALQNFEPPEPSSRRWSEDPFNNLDYLGHYSEVSDRSPIPLSDQDDLTKANTLLINKKFIYAQYGFRGLIGVASLAFFFFRELNWIIFPIGLGAEIAANACGGRQDQIKRQGENLKKKIYDKIKMDYSKLARRLIVEFANIPIGGHMRSHQRNTKNKIIGISKNLLRENLELIKQDLIKIKLYNLSIDRDIVWLQRYNKVTSCFFSASVQPYTDLKIKEISDLLKPLYDAASLIEHVSNTVSNVDTIVIQSNPFYEIYMNKKLLTELSIMKNFVASHQIFIQSLKTETMDKSCGVSVNKEEKEKKDVDQKKEMEEISQVQPKLGKKFKNKNKRRARARSTSFIGVRNENRPLCRFKLSEYL